VAGHDGGKSSRTGHRASGGHWVVKGSAMRFVGTGVGWRKQEVHGLKGGTSLWLRPSRNVPPPPTRLGICSSGGQEGFRMGDRDLLTKTSGSRLEGPQPSAQDPRGGKEDLRAEDQRVYSNKAKKRRKMPYGDPPVI